MKCGICHKPTELWEDNDVLCEECSQKPRYRYYALLRPPGYAAVPNGWCLKKYWTPQQQVSGDAFYAHGWVEYPQPLTFDSAWRFDLFPADEDEREKYREWYEENRR